MRNYKYVLFVLMFFVSGNVSAQYADAVDPRIGSGGHGHVFVGANVPWGMVNVGPVQPYHGWDWWTF